MSSTVAGAKRRGPIGRLDLETIVTAGVTLAARPGVRSITVRELGRELKADPSAIYKHVAGKDDLLRALIDRVTGMILAECSGITDWREFLVRNAMATLEIYVAHPAIGSEAFALSSGGENELALVDRILRAFRDAGLDRERAARHYAVYSVFVLSFCAGAATVLTRPDERTERWTDLPAELDAAARPNLVESRALLDDLTGVVAFGEGLRVLVDAAAADAEGA